MIRSSKIRIAYVTPTNLPLQPQYLLNRYTATENWILRKVKSFLRVAEIELRKQLNGFAINKWAVKDGEWGLISLEVSKSQSAFNSIS